MHRMALYTPSFLRNIPQSTVHHSSPQIPQFNYDNLYHKHSDIGTHIGQEI